MPANKANLIPSSLYPIMIAPMTTAVHGKAGIKIQVFASVIVSPSIEFTV